ncbi:MAG: cobalamin-binding protein [Crocinitomicaceae bacterium]|nr:cobalamin-binding protein [Crocinitomicaceae bacterium]
MNREVRLNGFPKRIVSLVPSQTEYLFDLGLEDRVVGITKFCIHPVEWYLSKRRVGGTKKIDIEKVKKLNPDLIIGNKEENTEEDIAALAKIAPVWMSDIYTLEDAFAMMLEIGKMCGLKHRAEGVVTEIRQNFENYAGFDISKSVIYLIWNDPLMASGSHTFIDEMIRTFGLRNFYGDQERYPECVPDPANQPDYIFLSSEPFPFKESHKQEIQEQFPGSKVVFVDGEIFSWYGSRMLKAPAYFGELKKQL